MSTTTLSTPVEVSRQSTRDHWNAVIASTVGWTLDSFDYFVVVRTGFRAFTGLPK